MGTNYYAVKKTIFSFIDPPQLHIGKSSCGWPFLFHGYRSVEDTNGFSKTPIVSFADWEQVLNPWVKIVDEYGTEHTVQDFLEFVRKHAEYAVREHEVRDYRDWFDEDGYFFIDAEFS